MAKLPEILKKAVVAKSRFFTVEELELRFANGVQRTYERLRTGPVGAVLVVPLLDADTVLMIREYGCGVEDYTLGLPKGALEADETLEQGANRELQEETGYGARTLTPLKELTLSPSYMGARLTVVLAEDLFPARLEGDEPEPIEVVPMSLAQLEQWVWRDDLHEARSVAALYLVRDLLRARRNGTAEPEDLP
ncbi:MAG: nudE [Moraxellaceae bacterium]|jgi:ADP-ribose diphosphatase|nr:nudE [Moraxellaceae bacterium]MDF3031853.1 nudE [Moraxellaceae bacterium]